MMFWHMGTIQKALFGKVVLHRTGGTEIGSRAAHTSWSYVLIHIKWVGQSMRLCCPGPLERRVYCRGVVKVFVSRGR